MKIIMVAVALSLSACATTAPSSYSVSSTPPRVFPSSDEVFYLADFNHDGRLSMDEAERAMPRIANNFRQVDVNQDGYVSYQEIRTHLKLNYWERLRDRML